MDLVMPNWDHIGVNIVPKSLWTLCRKRVQERTEVDDKHQIIVVISATASFLPFQLIYQGKTPWHRNR